MSTGSARTKVEAALARIAGNPAVNAFTDIVAERALRTADAVDAGRVTGPLAGIPFAVKNLFDIEGLPTRAGSRINRERPPAARDAFLIRRLEAAGAVLVGALNMGEYAYDFTGENGHDGPSRNPHDLSRMTGGSSGGSGAAVAAGLVPIALGSDTNGSIRVPASLCGLFGLKPTYGRLSRAGTFPFVSSFDHLGPLAHSAEDLALAYDAMQGPDPDDPAQIPRPFEPTLPELRKGIDGLRIAIAGGYFARGGTPEAYAAVAMAAEALGATRIVEFPEAARARAAAYVITAAEGAALHAERLRDRPQGFRPGRARPAHRRAGHPRRMGHPRPTLPALVSRSGPHRVRRRRHRARPSHTGPRAAAGSKDSRTRRRHRSTSPQPWDLHSTDLLHRPTGRCCPVLARCRTPHRRPTDRRALARGPRASSRFRLGQPAIGPALEGGRMHRVIRPVLTALALLTALPSIASAATLRWAAARDIGSLDPDSFGDTFTLAFLYHFYEGLVRYDDHLKIEPALAESWEIVEPKRWRFICAKAFGSTTAPCSPPTTSSPA